MFSIQCYCNVDQVPGLHIRVVVDGSAGDEAAEWAMVDAISIAYVMVSSTRQRRRQASEGDPLDWGIKEIEREPIRVEGEARIWAIAGASSVISSRFEGSMGETPGTVNQ